MKNRKQFKDLLKANPWPHECPNIDVLDHGWLAQENRDNLKGLLIDINEPLVIELGTWVGKSAKFMLDLNDDLRIVTIDTFRGSPELLSNPEFVKMIDSGLKPQAQRNLFDYRKRCCILELQSHVGLIRLYRNGLKPDLIYIDASHEYSNALRDMKLALEFFPDAIVCGDDSNFPGVARALCHIEDNYDIKGIFENGAFWRIVR